jgi:predicted transcriptional regulator
MNPTRLSRARGHTQKEIEMAKTQFNVEQFKTEAVRPLFAVAGAAELAVDFARGYATEAQKSAQAGLDAVQARVSRVERDPKALQSQARTLVNARVEDLTKEAKDAQAKFEARIAELQKDAKEFPARFQGQVTEAVNELTSTYADLATRGEKFVAAIRKDGVKAVTAKPVKKSTRKAAAKKAPATKATAKKAPAKKKTAAKKASATKATA